MPPATNSPSEAFIVSHTHWDREWYRTYHQFRANLVRVVRHVLESLESEPEFRHFLLDGQSIVLDDYLEIHPEHRSRIARQVEAGALSVGPWYILPDEFLVSAESTVRNLLIGHEVGRGVGHVQKVGYMPDSFGHIAQLPQILRQAGIDSFVYTRGNGDEIERLGHEFLWQAPDGSEVLAINQCGGYCNAGGLGLAEGWQAHADREVDPELAVEQVRDLFAKMGPLSQGDVYLLSNGCDHYPPQPKLGAILWALRRAFPDTAFRHASLTEYLERVRSAGFVRNRFAGELIRGRLHFILSGVWSARMYLKQQNDRAQRSLTDYLEPLSAYMHLVHARPYPRGLIAYAWKRLLENHPHDSICGCSVDEVHRDMEPRFASVFETAEEIVREHLVSLTPTFGRRASDDEATVLCVANPLPVTRSEVVERLIVLQTHGVDPDRLELVDDAGCPVRFAVVRHDFVERFWGVDYRTELFGERQRDVFQSYREQLGERIHRTETERDPADCYLTVHFEARDLPALGHATYRLRERSSPEPVTQPGAVQLGGQEIENQLYSVRVHDDGTFDVTDKRTGHRYAGLNTLSDTEDVGDEYDYAPCSHSRTVTSRGASGTVRPLESTDLAGRLEAVFDLLLPRSIEPDRQRRSDHLAPCQVRARIGLATDSPIIDVELLFDNQAKDHRLRAEFPVSIQTDTVVSDGQFYLNCRPIAQPEGQHWLQPPSGTYPQQDFTLLQDEVRGVAVLNRGLPEIEAIPDGSGGVGLALTLLRSVGWLSRDDFDTRRRKNAGPMIATPGAQCLGQHRFHYAVVPFAGDHLTAGIKLLSQRWRTPVVAVQGVDARPLPGAVGLLELQSSHTAVSAVKLHERSDHLVVRLYNLTSERVQERLTFGLPVHRAWRVNLLEERVADLTAGTEHLTLSLQPHEIVTIEAEMGNAW